MYAACRISISNTKVSFSSVQSLSPVRLFATPWIAARQASLSITNSWSSPKLMSIESVMPSSYLILCHLLLLLPPIPPSIRVFSNESALCMMWPKYWSFSFSISPSKEDPGLISFRMDWISDLTSFNLIFCSQLELFSIHRSLPCIMYHMRGANEKLKIIRNNKWEKITEYYNCPILFIRIKSIKYL